MPFSRLPRIGLVSLALLLGPLSPALLAADTDPPPLQPPAVALSAAITADPARSAAPAPASGTAAPPIAAMATAMAATAAPVSSASTTAERPGRVDDDRTRRAQLAAARAAIRRGDLAGALRLLDQHARRSSDDDYRADRETLMAQIRQRQNAAVP
jgi:hypothetical protein